MNLDTLLAEREISRAVTRFARAMDDRDWAVLHEILLPDATAKLGTGTLHGPAEVVALIRSFLDNCGPTQHLLGNQLIDVDGDKAVSRTYVSDMHLGMGEREGLSFCTLGDYHDQWARVDGVWRMSHRTKNMGGSLGDIEVFGGAIARRQQRCRRIGADRSKAARTRRAASAPLRIARAQRPSRPLVGE